MEYQKLKFKANCNKNRAKLIKYESCTSSIFYAYYDPTSKRYQIKNVNVFMKKVIQPIVKFGQSRLNMQAVHLAGSIFYVLKILPARGTRPNKKKKKNGYEFLKKVIQGSVRLIGSAEKLKM